MITDLNICSYYLHINLENDTLFRYIVNRFIGFVTNDTNSPGMTVTDITCDDLKVRYGCSFLEEKENCLICERNASQLVYFVSDFAVILYDNTLNVCYVCLKDCIGDNYIHLVGVQVANIIIEYLVQNDIYCVHSSVVTFNKRIDSGIMFIGDSGAGKTSLAYEFLKKGEQITNDDVAFVRVENNNLKVYKNTQYIGMDDDSISKLYPECVHYIVKKDGLTLDKNRVDLLKLNESAFAANIIVKKIVIIDKNRNSVANLCTLDGISAYRILFKAIVPFLPRDLIIHGNIIDTIVSQKLPLYRLTPTVTAKGTVDFLYEKFRENKNI